MIFCMSSKESAANLQPLQSPVIRPDLVIVAITEQMQREGEVLVSEIKAGGLAVKSVILRHETSLSHLSSQFEQIVETYFEHEIIVNLTGGNKLMALAAYQVFAGYGYRCFYQDYVTGDIIWLDDETRLSGHQHKMKLERYLKAYQFEVKRKKQLSDLSKAHKDFVALIVQYLNKNYEKNKSLVSKLNAHASKPKLPSYDLAKNKFDHEEEAFLAHLSHVTKVFRLDKNGLVFCDPDDQRLVAGQWLEIYTAEALNQVQDLRDLSLSVEIVKSTQRKTSKMDQELDVMAMHLQRLLLVECKTVHWKSANDATDASEAIYKLTALGNIGGLNTQPCFVSLYDLPPAAKTRAAENNIHIICGKNILQLVQQFKGWLNQANN